MELVSASLNHEIKLLHPHQANEAGKLKQWMYERVAPYALGNILEIGSGSGNISDLFLQHKVPICLSDHDVYYCQQLRDKYESNKNAQIILQIDLNDQFFEERYTDLLEQFDTIVSLNIADHISHDRTALHNAKKLLKAGGYLIVLVPAYFALYRELDQGFNHWHKYNIQYLQKLLGRNCTIIKTKYFNLVGIVRMFLSNTTPDENQQWNQKNQYHELVPTFYIDDLAFKQIGLSVIVMAEKIN